MTQFKNCWMIGLVLCAGQLLAQAGPAPIYVESFRKGRTRIAETSYQVTLDIQHPSYQARVKDSSGDDHFQLSMTPVRVGEEDASILSWQVSLVDRHRRMYGTLLLPYRDNSLNGGPQGHVFWLDPDPYAMIPLLAKRVVKIEGFYCVIQVKNYHHPVPERRPLDAMGVDVQFTNTNPLSSVN